MFGQGILKINMNNIPKYYRIAFYFFAVMILFSCEKPVFDYRNKYVGDWKYTVVITEINTDSVGYFRNDTIVYYGEITHADNKDKLVLNYTQSDSLELYINKDGNLSVEGFDYTDGNMTKDELNFYFRWGGIGTFIEHDIVGKKLR